MSAPIAIEALVTLYRQNPFDQSLCWWLCGGDVGEGEHFPAFRAGSGSGGSTAGRRSRSSTYPQAFLVNSSRCAIAEVLELTLSIAEADPGANAGPRVGHRRIGMEVELFLF